MNTCPHCQQTAMNALRKSFLSPGRAVSCQNCGEPVAVPIWSYALIILAVLIIFFLPLSLRPTLGIGTAVLMLVLWNFLPLQKAEQP
jgi:hypothetical protein